MKHGLDTMQCPCRAPPAASGPWRPYSDPHCLQWLPFPLYPPEGAAHCCILVAPLRVQAPVIAGEQ